MKAPKLRMRCWVPLVMAVLVAVPFVVWQLSRGEGEQENTLAACLEDLI